MTYETLDKWIERFCNLSLLTIAFAFGVFLFVGMMGCGKLAIAIGVSAYLFVVFSVVREWLAFDELEAQLNRPASNQ